MAIILIFRISKVALERFSEIRWRLFAGCCDQIGNDQTALSTKPSFSLFPSRLTRNKLKHNSTFLLTNLRLAPIYDL